MTYIGQPVRRLEDPPLITGKAAFVADLAFSGEVSMRVVRSQVASGRILSVDVDQARELPGVVAVWTADDLDIPPIGFRMTDVGGMEGYRQPVLASDYVRYVGEPVAVVFAEDAYLAEDAADLVWVDIEDLEPELDATRPGTFHPGMPAEAALIEKAYGDVEAAMGSSETRHRTGAGRWASYRCPARDPGSDRSLGRRCGASIWGGEGSPLQP